MTLKRRIYGLPIMRGYREYRTGLLAGRHRHHFGGFRFAGTDSFFDPAWEREEREVMERQIAAADVFIDIGANQGLYTCMAASRGKQVVAIEPEAGNLRFLLSNVAANDFSVEVFAVALAERPGVTELFGDGDTASLVAGWAAARSSFAQRVPVNTLDNLASCRWAGASLFIKMDVEGFELPVLRGAGAMLTRDPKPCWLIETFPVAFDRDRTRNADFVAIFELMEDHGYLCTSAQTGEPVSVDLAREWARDGAQAEVGRSNYLFRPA